MLQTKRCRGSFLSQVDQFSPDLWVVFGSIDGCANRLAVGLLLQLHLPTIGTASLPLVLLERLVGIMDGVSSILRTYGSCVHAGAVVS